MHDLQRKVLEHERLLKEARRKRDSEIYRIWKLGGRTYGDVGGEFGITRQAAEQAIARVRYRRWREENGL